MLGLGQGILPQVGGMFPCADAGLAKFHIAIVPKTHSVRENQDTVFSLAFCSVLGHHLGCLEGYGRSVPKTIPFGKVPPK